MGLYTNSGIFSGFNNSGKNGGIIQSKFTPVNGVVSASGDGVQLSQFETSITPCTSNSHFIIIVSLGMVSSNTSNSLTFEVRRGSSSINDMRGNADGSRPRRTFRTDRNWNGDANHGHGITFIVQDSPGSTGSKQYNLYAHPQNNNTCYINRTENDSNGSNNYQSRVMSSMLVLEVGDN